MCKVSSPVKNKLQAISRDSAPTPEMTRRTHGVVVSSSYMDILPKSVREERERELQAASVPVQQESKVITGF